MKPIKLNSWQSWLLHQALGTKTGDTIEQFLAVGLVDAIQALTRGDIAGFLAALPENLREILVGIVKTEH